MRDYIDRIIKPKLQGDGGEIDFISYENGVLTATYNFIKGTENGIDEQGSTIGILNEGK